MNKLEQLVQAVEGLNESLNKFNECKKILNKQKLCENLSELDKEISAIYHGLEVTVLNKNQSAIVIKRLQEVLLKRREIKTLIHIVNTIDKSAIVSKVDSLKATLKNSVNACKSSDTFIDRKAGIRVIANILLASADNGLDANSVEDCATENAIEEEIKEEIKEVPEEEISVEEALIKLYGSTKPEPEELSLASPSEELSLDDPGDFELHLNSLDEDAMMRLKYEGCPYRCLGVI